MSKLIYSIVAISVLVGGAARADDNTTKNYVLALAYGYDRECEKIPNPYRNRIFVALEANSGTELDVALGRVGAQVRREGSTAFCTKFKDFMAEAFKP